MDATAPDYRTAGRQAWPDHTHGPAAAQCAGALSGEVSMSEETITKQDAVSFLETAGRNWRFFPRISDDDIEDVRSALVGIVRKFSGGKQEQEEIERLTAERDSLKTQLAKAMHVVKGWAEWHQLVENDPADDLPYLNGKAWDDAEALADNAQTFLRSISKEEQR